MALRPGKWPNPASHSTRCLLRLARGLPTAPRSLATERTVVRTAPSWRPSVVLDEWVQRDAMPISLRQLTWFGRTLTESRLLSSANYVRTELPTRLAHRLRDMQTLPYVVLSNPHLTHVYELYYKAFERFRRIREIQTLDDNDRFCTVLKEMLQEHLTVIPRLAIGVLEVQGTMLPDATDKFMTTLLRSRISRRVIAEQHLALTETFHSPWHFPNAKQQPIQDTDFVGEIFLRCNAKEIIEQCAETTRSLMRVAHGQNCALPEIKIYGNPDAMFPYIQSHLEYVIGEILRNSMQALAELPHAKNAKPNPIEVLICETAQHVIMRFSDKAGGIPKDILPYIWSFSKGPRKNMRLKNLQRVPKMAATMQELGPDTASSDAKAHFSAADVSSHETGHSSLSSLTSRPPNLRLGIGLPMSRIYAEYWAGSLEIHSLEGYGTDAFLQISKLGNKNEQLMIRQMENSV